MMTRLLKVGLASLLFVGLATPLPAQVDYGKDGPWDQRAESGPDAQVPGWFYNLGITGLRARLVPNEPKALLIKYVFPKSPADGHVKVGDLVVGVGGRMFQEKHRNGYGEKVFGADGPIAEFAKALEECQGGGGQGKLPLAIRRGKEIVNVELDVGRVYGTYSGTFPIDCAKSDKILAELLKYLVDHQAKDGSFGDPVHNTFAPLALLASGDAKFLPAIERNARYHSRQIGTRDLSLINWTYMSAAIVLSEYHLATGEKWVLPELQKVHDRIAKSQYLDMSQINPQAKKSHPDDYPKGPKDSHGGWGHNPGFEGYGPIAMLTGQGALAYSLMQRCGIKIDRKNHDAAYAFLAKGTGKNGYVWYGDKIGGGPEGWADMGRTGASGIANFLSPYPDAAYRERALAHAKVIGKHPQSFPDTHGSPAMGMAYTALAANVDSDSFRKLMDANRWWFTMAQCTDGSFYYQPNRDNAGYGSDSRMLASSVVAFVFSIPKKSLVITGKEAKGSIKPDENPKARDDSKFESKNPAQKIAPVKLDPAGDPLPPSAVSRLGTLRWAHGAEVDHAIYLRDGQQVLTVDQNGLFRVWDTPTGQLLRRFGTGDCKSVYWHVYDKNEKTEQIERVGNPHTNHVVAVTADETVVAIAHGDGNVTLWEIAGGRKLETFATNVATTLAFSPDGQSLFTRGLDQLVRQYDVRTGKEIRIFGEPRSNGKLVYFNDSGGLTVSADNKTAFSIRLERQGKLWHVSVHSWEIATGKELPVLVVDQAMEGFASIAFSLRAKLVAFSDLKGVIHVWDIATFKEVHHLAGPEPDNGGYLSALAFSSDGRKLLARSSSRSMHLWDMTDGKEVRHLQVPKDRPSDFFTGHIAFSSDGSRIISPGRAGTVRQIDTKSGKEIEQPLSRHRNLVEALSLSADGKTAVTLSHDHVLHQWSVEEGTELKQVPLSESFDHASFSQDGKVLALAGYDDKLHLRLWDAAQLKELREWDVSSELDGRPTPSRRYASDLTLSANGKRLAVREYGSSVRVWEVETEKDKRVKELPFFREKEDELYLSGRRLAISPDGTLFADLVMEKKGQISFRLSEVTTGKLIRRFDIAQPTIRAFAFSPNGRMIAATDADRTISLWEVATGKQRACLGRERSAELSTNEPEIPRSSMLGSLLSMGQLICIAYSPDGNLLAAGDSSGRVRLFDMTTDKELDCFAGHIGPVVSLAFAANGKRLASGSTDTTALVWDIIPQARQAQQRQNLEAKELERLWQDLGGDDAPKAHRAIRVLCEFPKQVVPFLQARLRRIEIDQKQLDRLIGDLDDNKFAVREKAQQELEKLGELAEKAIGKALEGRFSLDVKTRLEKVRSLTRNRVCDTPPSDQIRALEVLELIGTSEAREAVQIIARGTPGARITRDAQATLERMASKSK